jgi:hypothetical protein
MVDSLPRSINDMLSSAGFRDDCEAEKQNVTEVEAWCRNIPPGSQQMKDLVQQIDSRNHFPKELLPNSSAVIAESMASQSQSSSSRQKKPKHIPTPKIKSRLRRSSGAQARPSQPQATRASPAQPEPTARSKTFTQPIPGQAGNKGGSPPKGHGKTSGQKGKKGRESGTLAHGGKGKKRKAEEQEREDLPRQIEVLQRARVKDLLRATALDREKLERERLGQTKANNDAATAEEEEDEEEEEEFAEQDQFQEVCGANRACPNNNLPKMKKLIIIPGDVYTTPPLTSGKRDHHHP